MITDTSFLIDLMKNERNALNRLEEIEKNKESQCTTSSSIFKLATGIAMSQWPEKEKRKVEVLLFQFLILNFKKDHALVAGKILGELYKIGQLIDPVDAQIAGKAVSEKQTVVTRNIKHFERISGLSIESY